MKEEIKEILEDNGELMVRYKDNSFECFDTLPKNVVDYITNLQTIEQQYSAILSENAELENKITNLQKENERLTQGVALLTSKFIDMKKEKEDYKSRIDKAMENCKKSIESINQKLQDDKTIKVIDGKVVNMNEYQIVRLKAIRMKCKELLSILGGKENE